MALNILFAVRNQRVVERYAPISTRRARVAYITLSSLHVPFKYSSITLASSYLAWRRISNICLYRVMNCDYCSRKSSFTRKDDPCFKSPYYHTASWSVQRRSYPDRDAVLGYRCMEGRYSSRGGGGFCRAGFPVGMLAAVNNHFLLTQVPSAKMWPGTGSPELAF